MIRLNGLASSKIIIKRFLAIPKEINAPDLQNYKSSNVKNVSCSEEYNQQLDLANKETSLYSFGVGSIGSLGFGDFNTRNSPEINDILLSEGIKPVKVSAGWGHTACVDREGGLHMWGRTHDISNILFLARWGGIFPFLFTMIGNILSLTPLGLDKNILLPVLQNHKGAKVKDVSCSAGFSVALTESGRVLTVGNNRYGKLGLGHIDSNINNWVPVCHGLEKHKIIKISTGMAHTAALSEDGSLFTWGRADRGQLGHGNNMSDALSPKKVDSLFSHKVVDIACGTSHTVCVLENGKVYIWGKYMSKVPRVSPLIGREYGFFSDQLLPRLVPLDSKVVSCASSSHQVVLRTNKNELLILGLKSNEYIEHDKNVQLFEKEPLWKKREILHDNSKKRMFHDPIEVSNELLKDYSLTKIVGGNENFYALTKEGPVFKFCLGLNPVLYDKVNNLNVLDMSEGWGHTHFICA